MTPDETTKRLQYHEQQQAKHWKWILGAMITAIGAGGGTGLKALSDSDTVERLQLTVAEHVATDSVRWETANAERNRLIDQVAALRDTVADLKATIRETARSRRTREMADAVEIPEASSPRPAPSSPIVPRETVRAVQRRLFE